MGRTFRDVANRIRHRRKPHFRRPPSRSRGERRPSRSDRRPFLRNTTVVIVVVVVDARIFTLQFIESIPPWPVCGPDAPETFASSTPYGALNPRNSAFHSSAGFDANSSTPYFTSSIQIHRSVPSDIKRRLKVCWSTCGTCQHRSARQCLCSLPPPVTKHDPWNLPALIGHLKKRPSFVGFYTGRLEVLFLSQRLAEAVTVLYRIEHPFVTLHVDLRSSRQTSEIPDPTPTPKNISRQPILGQLDAPVSPSLPRVIDNPNRQRTRQRSSEHPYHLHLQHAAIRDERRFGGVINISGHVQSFCTSIAIRNSGSESNDLRGMLYLVRATSRSRPIYVSVSWLLSECLCQIEQTRHGHCQRLELLVWRSSASSLEQDFGRRVQQPMQRL